MTDDEQEDQKPMPPAGHGMVRIPLSATADFAELCRQGRQEAKEIAELEDVYARVAAER